MMIKEVEESEKDDKPQTLFTPQLFYFFILRI